MRQTAEPVVLQPGDWFDIPKKWIGLVTHIHLASARPLTNIFP